MTSQQRFIDDIFGFFCGSREDMEEFKVFMNNQDPNNKDFIMEFDQDTR